MVQMAAVNPLRDAQRVKVAINPATTQDSTVILVTMVDRLGKQWYANSFNWSPYKGLDMLDVTDVCTVAPVVETAPHVREIK